MKVLLIDILGMRILLVSGSVGRESYPHIAAPKNDLTLYLSGCEDEVVCNIEDGGGEYAILARHALYLYLFSVRGYPFGEYDIVINGVNGTLINKREAPGQYMENVGKCNGIFTNKFELKGVGEIDYYEVCLGRYIYRIYECHDCLSVDMSVLGARILMEKTCREPPRSMLAASFLDGKIRIREMRFGKGVTVPDAYAIGAAAALYRTRTGSSELRVEGEFGNALATLSDDGEVLVGSECFRHLELDI